MPGVPKYVTPDEWADIAGVKRKSVTQYIYNNQVAIVRTSGKRALIDVDKTLQRINPPK